ncbi:MAG: acylphosphatase [Roseburia sp.]|nr:acylphosphatase [Roseburia sp.]
MFVGLVQGVGFRYETWMIAQKFGLTGFVQNLPDGSVYAEIQGPKNKILYLIECLQSVPRIQIEKMRMDEMELKEESHFEIA